MILPILSFIILGIYTLWFCLKYGIPESLSQSYYSLPWKPLFQIIIVSSSFLLLPELMKGGVLGGIPFIGVIGLMMVGIFPNIREKFERLVHICGATIGSICSIIWIVLFGNLYTLGLWSVPLILLLVKGTTPNFIDKYKFVFWIEIICYISIYLNLFIIWMINS